MRKLLVFAAVVFSLVAGGAALAAEPDSITFLLPVSEGLGSEGFSKTMKNMAIAIGKDAGFKMNYDQLIYKKGQEADNTVYDRLKKGQAQLSYVNSMEYIENRKKWDEIFTPVFTLSFNKKPYNQYCIYTKKSGGVSTIQEARGKVWGGMDTIYTRLILHENGIDEPLSTFFSATKYVVDQPIPLAIEAQRKGEIDFFTAVKAHVMMGGGVPKSSSSSTPDAPITYKELACADGNYGWIFGFSKAVPKDTVIKITKSVLKAHSDKNFAEFKMLFAAIKGKFELVKPADLKRTEEIVAMKKKLGWDKEQTEFHKKAK